MPFSWEPVLLFLLVVVSTALFVRNLVRKLSPVFSGAFERQRLNHPGARLARTLREVFLQTRVVSGRPVVGLLHAAVFLGFLGFAPETVEHFLKGFGVSLLEPVLGPALPLYRGAMTVVAVVVTVAILGLAFRRFVLVRYSPDPRSWTSGVVAAFIVILMLTYLNGLQADPIAEQASWWVHALVILAFPHLIIRSKHFHIFVAPINLFLRSERLGEYAPIDLEAISEGDVEDVTLGLETIGSLPWKMRLDFLSCVECRRCVDNCPAALAGNETDTRSLMLEGRTALYKFGADDPVIGHIVSEAALGYCATCGACENSCAVGIEHLQFLVGAKRAQALATGRGVVAGEFFRAIESHGNALRLPASEREATITELELPKFTGARDQWLLWLGCVWGYSPDQRQAVAAFKQVMDAARVPFGVLDEEPCCGHHSRRQGEESQFQDLARRSLELLSQNGVHRIVTPCPHCLHTLKREHSQFNGHLETQIVHHSQLISRLIEDGNLRPLRKQLIRATYHDPCYLARYEGISREPRSILGAAGYSLTELPHNESRTLCCGGGAAGFAREQKTGQRLDQPRRKEILASGADVLVTACPECRMMLGAVVDQTKDLAEVVAESIRIYPPESGDRPAKGGQMLLSTPYSEDLATQIMDVFQHDPTCEMQLLNVAGKAHFSGKLCDLRHAADHLVETGELILCEHGGGRYYRLANRPPAASKEDRVPLA
jgi:Fe-S oxidoreductase